MLTNFSRLLHILQDTRILECAVYKLYADHFMFPVITLYILHRRVVINMVVGVYYIVIIKFIDFATKICLLLYLYHMGGCILCDPQSCNDPCAKRAVNLGL